MVAAMTRHLHSLRRLKRDHGWIHTLLGTDHAIGYINVIYAYSFDTCNITLEK